MCNRRCVDRLRRVGFGRMALVMLSVSGCFPLAAQIPGRPAFGSHAGEFDAIFENHAMPDWAFPPRDIAQPSDPSPVSVDALRHPLNRKARRLLETALGYAESGEHARAITILQDGVAKIAAIAPYAHNVLGVEYLRTGRNAEAVKEFDEAATSLPHDAVVRTNFAVSLCITGQFTEAEREARLALSLDPSSASAQELMRMLKADESRRLTEAGRQAAR
jgi:tetratricopeptide (TPR) repeat protein